MKIVTHTGKAHRDDFLACCIALFTIYREGHTAVVERRVPCIEDLEAKDVWVIDTGERHSEEFLNFDHHQLQIDDICALDLVLKFVYGEKNYQLFRKDNVWLQQTSYQDNCGTTVAAQKLGLAQFVYKSIRSPVETAFLERFGRQSYIVPDTLIHTIMLDIGRVLHAQIMDATADVVDLFREAPVTNHAGVRVMDLRYAASDGRMTTANTSRYASIARVDVSIGMSQRNNGHYALYRFPWATEKVDFNRISSGEVSFVHASGHYAVIGRPNDTLLGKMIDEAVVNKKL